MIAEKLLLLMQGKIVEARRLDRRDKARRRYHNSKAADPYFLEKTRARKRARYTSEESQRQMGRMLKWRYGISIEDKQKMLRKQHGKCSICLSSISFRKACVDHCHKTGRVRGLLCSLCNKALGLFGDRVNNLRRAIRHLGGG